MKVIVMGAGVVGVCTAWYLSRAGHEVVVIDRQGDAALETSFANGGQISVSQSVPWASPDAPLQILRWLGRADSPLLFRPKLDPRQWDWGVRFLLECRDSRLRRNMSQMLELGLYSRQSLQALREETGIDYDQCTRGIVCLYQTRKELDHAAECAKWMRPFGIDRRLVEPGELAALDPALADVAPTLAGATYCADDESGDASLFTRKLAALCADNGVRFLFHTRINALEHDGQQLTGVSVTGPDGFYRSEHADGYVLALGSHSPLLAQPLGVHLPVYPTKGYSATFAVNDPSRAPQLSITDESRHIVFSRLGDRLRVAGTAELSGYSSHLDPVRCAALTTRARALFPDAADYTRPQYWTGLRPSTPSNVPLIGRVRRYGNLFLNTGHGTLGWTEGPGSGRLLADIISGRPAGIDFALFR